MKYLSISTSTLGKLRKYLSKVQVLSNLYLSVYLSISTHVLGPMSGTSYAELSVVDVGPSLARCLVINSHFPLASFY